MSSSSEIDECFICLYYISLKIVIPPRDQMDNKTIKEVILHDKECPLSICLDHAQKNEGLKRLMTSFLHSDLIDRFNYVQSGEMSIGIYRNS